VVEAGADQCSHRACLKPVVDTGERLTLARMGREDSTEVGMLKGGRLSLACRQFEVD
jgi:hypothetical protein